MAPLAFAPATALPLLRSNSSGVSLWAPSPLLRIMSSISWPTASSSCSSHSSSRLHIVNLRCSRTRRRMMMPRKRLCIRWAPV
eukprot:4421432-Prymnesium_polylepis.1